ncbi:type IA DNA topoisomerase [Xenorhabdus cabanillasii]|uniref:DNA topoisomerase n=1 Tax=Xenorhabdus cabanillasii JM26 TaxID=1427517 RepID=W1J9F6_9GAMM|nr:type IA DNA topoisomerase [Xenorhabdus cabanillasii]PHM75511.1 DNA topoisomerase I [Xenorhabdus cabanillasii JM26]CDL86648.1 Topoisomerase [Xenorhabdus cabanillasii JM26]
MKLRPVKQVVNDKTADQFAVLARLISQADEIVHAGDPDEEGQLIVDEVLQYCGSTVPVKRLLINDLNPETARKALRNMRDNSEFTGLYKRAYARNVADYLYGIQVTRAYTIAGREKGHNEVISVGRVQTPILGMIVRRYAANQNHKESWYWQVQATITGTNMTIPALLVVPEDAPVDDKGRIIQEGYAQEIVELCQGKNSTVTRAKVEDKTKAAPLPFALLDLQAKMSRLYDFSPEKTLKITQDLRENYKAITYNRSDCRYLPTEQFAEAPQTLNAISSTFPELSKFFEQTDSMKKGRAFNDSKITAHTAIIPTAKHIDVNSLTGDEQKVYRAIVEQYLAQFLPEKGFKSALAEFDIVGHQFRKRAIRNTVLGWSVLLTDKDESEEQDNGGVFDELAKLNEGDVLECANVDSKREKTTPPPLYTVASLLEDLRRVARYVGDPHIKQLLLDRDEEKDDQEQGGIGTPATRGAILTLLQERGFFFIDKKKVIPSPLGLSFIQALPPIMTTPDMTALWHEQQKMIETGELEVDSFLDELEKFVAFQVENVDVSGLKVTVYPCDCGGRYVRRKSENGAFWGCNNYPECRNAVPDRNGQPDFTAQNFVAKCPKCSSKMKLNSKACNCSNENCKYVVWGTQFNKTLTITQISDLLNKGKTREIKGFKTKAGKKFDAILQLEKDGSIIPVFNNNKRK